MKVYCIENIFDGKKYVGITKGEITRRFKQHKEKAKRSIANKGIHAKENNPFYGKKHTKETIDKILSRVSKCVYCGKTAVNCNIKRWHNDNCKMKKVI